MVIEIQDNDELNNITHLCNINASIPIVALTTPNLREAVLEAGAMDWICLPFSAIELRLRLENIQLRLQDIRGSVDLIAHDLIIPSALQLLAYH